MVEFVRVGAEHRVRRAPRHRDDRRLPLHERRRLGWLQHVPGPVFDHLGRRGHRSAGDHPARLPGGRHGAGDRLPRRDAGRRPRRVTRPDPPAPEPRRPAGGRPRAAVHGRAVAQPERRPVGHGQRVGVTVRIPVRVAHRQPVTDTDPDPDADPQADGVADPRGKRVAGPDHPAAGLHPAARPVHHPGRLRRAGARHDVVPVDVAHGDRAAEPGVPVLRPEPDHRAGRPDDARHGGRGRQRPDRHVRRRTRRSDQSDGLERADERARDDLGAAGGPPPGDLDGRDARRAGGIHPLRLSDRCGRQTALDRHRGNGRGFDVHERQPGRGRDGLQVDHHAAGAVAARRGSKHRRTHGSSV